MKRNFGSRALLSAVFPAAALILTLGETAKAGNSHARRGEVFIDAIAAISDENLLPQEAAGEELPEPAPAINETFPAQAVGSKAPPASDPSDQENKVFFVVVNRADSAADLVILTRAQGCIAWADVVPRPSIDGYSEPYVILETAKSSGSEDSYKLAREHLKLAACEDVTVVIHK